MSEVKTETSKIKQRYTRLKYLGFAILSLGFFALIGIGFYYGVVTISKSGIRLLFTLGITLIALGFLFAITFKPTWTIIKKRANDHKKTTKKHPLAHIICRTMSPVSGYDTSILTMTFFIFALGILILSNILYTKGDVGNMIVRALYGWCGIIFMIFLSRVNLTVFNSKKTVWIFLILLAANSYNAILARITGGIERGFSEFLKITVILISAYMACYFASEFDPKARRFDRNVTKINQPRRSMPESKIATLLKTARRSNFSASVFFLAVITVAAAVVFLQSHLSACIIIFSIGFTMFYIAGGNKKFFWFGIFTVIFIGCVICFLVDKYPEAIISNKSLAYMLDRVYLWIKKPDPIPFELRKFVTGDRSQTMASLEAISLGGWFGTFFRGSIFKYQFLSDVHTDFIFASIVEEFGYIGGLTVVAIFVAYVARIFKVARTNTDMFSSLVTVGVGLHILIEVLLHIAVSTDTIPNTGITLPFFSFGGEALLCLFIEIGLVLSASKTSEATKESLQKLLKGKTSEKPSKSASESTSYTTDKTTEKVAK